MDGSTYRQPPPTQKGLTSLLAVLLMLILPSSASAIDKNEDADNGRNLRKVSQLLPVPEPQKRLRRRAEGTQTRAAYRFISLDVPGAVGTVANAINNAEEITGDYLDVSGAIRGFRLQFSGGQPQFTTISFPGSRNTFATGISDSGKIVGDYTDATGKYHTFVLNGRVFTTIDFPGASDTFGGGINNSTIVGTYRISSTAGSTYRGYSLDGGSFTTISVPDAKETFVFGLNSAGDAISGASADDSGNGQGVIFRVTNTGSISKRTIIIIIIIVEGPPPI